MSTNGFGGTEIVCILARQLITIAAMADVHNDGHMVPVDQPMVMKKKNDALHRDMAESAENGTSKNDGECPKCGQLGHICASLGDQCLPMKQMNSRKKEIVTGHQIEEFEEGATRKTEQSILLIIAYLLTLDSYTSFQDTNMLP
ncbi:hypothetical protein Tco_0025753 [Tanacetum coccineum]